MLNHRSRCLQRIVDVLDVGDTFGFQPLAECVRTLLRVDRDAILPSCATAGHAVEFHTDFGRGITAYLFLSEDLRKYRPISGVKVPGEGFLNFREAASMLGTRTEVIRGLVVQGILSTPAEYRLGLARLVPAADVRRFAERYVSTKVLAKRLRVAGARAACYLKQSGMPVLSIPVQGKGRALFLRQETAAHVRIVSTQLQ